MGPLTAFDGQIALYHVTFRDRQLALQPVVGQPSGSYATYPIPPRMGFITLKADI